ncbi:MAG: type I DNA topoisomerase [Chloroflexota bacterium]
MTEVQAIPIEAYCVKCKTKRTMQDPTATFTATGTPGTKGVCPVCGTNLFRMGATPAHAGLVKPAPQPRAPRKTKASKNGKPVASEKRSGKLVIVESPSKAKTIGKYLGREYQVRASIGHIRDLLKSQLSVDVDNGFAPKYRVPNAKKEVVKELTAAAARASEIYLATDPDREGEAIAWHLIAAAQIPEGIARRVAFDEITKGAITEAFAHPRAIDMNLVNAQQARRILDRLVGYQISPLLWEKVRGGLSAGRVQSAAVRLVVEREREIQAFVPVEYWSLEAELAKIETRRKSPRPFFVAKLAKVRGEDANLKNEADAQAIVTDLEGATYIVLKVKKSERKRNPSAPFTTSTLQQEASRKLGFSTKKTMAVAQQLYEGIDLNGEGTIGLITYMRTDSTNVAKVAQDEARALIAEKYGAEFVPPTPPIYKTKAKSAQEAHEAIRPTSARREPSDIKSQLSKDQFRLYDLIWKRFIASQMEAAIFDVTAVDVGASREWTVDGKGVVTAPLPEPPYLFRANGSIVKFMGFLQVYEEGKDDNGKNEDDVVGKVLPPLSDGEVVDLLRLLPEQHFTEPPPRYSEATLVKALEENGIGRPSTYAPTIATIVSRGYVENHEKRLHPTDVAFVVNDLLVTHFPEVVDLGFTAQMEGELDQIAEGEKEWVPVLQDFYGPFAKSLKKAERLMPNVTMEPEPTGELCPTCGRPLVMKRGRFGKFISCSGFPDCKFTKPLLKKIGVTCPKDGGEIVERKTKRGRFFFGCANYPACDFASWNRPVPQKCPKDGGLMVVAGKDKVKCTVCETVYDAEAETAAGSGSNVKRER